MLDPRRRETLLKALRSPRFRAAVKAIAELRASRDATLAGVVEGYPAPDEQRAFQYRVARAVLEHGVSGLVTGWPALGDPKWRAELVSEIGQALDQWVDEATVDLMLAALDDPSRNVRAKAVWAIVGIVCDIPERERRAARAVSHRRAIAARDALRAWLTPARRSQITRGLLDMLDQHRQEPSVVLAQIVETLGYTATPDDVDALGALEALRSQSGEPFHVTHETLDESKLDWRDRLLAERKGIAPERIKARISYRPTGLLDQKVLIDALERIQAQGDRRP